MRAASAGPTHANSASSGKTVAHAAPMDSMRIIALPIPQTGARHLALPARPFAIRSEIGIARNARPD